MFQHIRLLYQEHVQVIQTAIFSDCHYTINATVLVERPVRNNTEFVVISNWVMKCELPKLEKYAFRGSLLILNKIMTSFSHTK